MCLCLTELLIIYVWRFRSPMHPARDSLEVWSRCVEPFVLCKMRSVRVVVCVLLEIIQVVQSGRWEFVLSFSAIIDEAHILQCSPLERRGLSHKAGRVQVSQVLFQECD